MTLVRDHVLRRRVGAAIRAARQARGLTQRQLAGPYTAAFVSRVESGDAIPSLEALSVLTERLDLPLAEFFLLVAGEDSAKGRLRTDPPPPRAPQEVIQTS